MFQNNLLMGAASISAGGLTVDNSVRYNDDDSPYLRRCPVTLGNRMTGSISLWYKRSNLGSIQQLFNVGAGNDITFNASDKLTFIDAGAAGAGTDTSYITTQVFRDPSAWGHLLFAWDTTLDTAGDRLRIYHNGVEITAFDTETNPTKNTQFQISNVVDHTIGANEGGTEEFDGYLSQFYYVDGQQLTPSAFGEFDSNGVWRPIEFAADGTGLSGTVVPIMTSATAPSGVVTGGTVANGQLWSPFNNISETTAGDSYLVLQGFPTTLSYDFGSGNEKTIITYTIKNDTGDLSRAPKDWKFQGSTDNFSSSVVDLDTVTGETSWGASEIRLFSFTNTTAYRYYRLNFSASSDATYVQMDAVNYLEANSGYGTNGFFLDFADANNLGLDAAGAAVSSTTYRYLKCNITRVTSTTFVAIGEMEYYVGSTLYPTQTMTANDAPSPLVASANNEYAPPYKAFTDVKNVAIDDQWQSNSSPLTPSFLQIDLGSGNGIAATSAAIFSGNTQDRTPLDFTIQGSNNDSDWTILATYSSKTAWPDQETRHYPLSTGNNFISPSIGATQVLSLSQVTDTPTKNYPTFASNMGNNFASAGDASTLSNGNLDIVGAESAVSLCDVNFVPLNTGKWYFTWLHDTWYNMNNDMGITNDLNRAIQNGTASGGYTGDAGAVLVGLELSTKYNIQSADFTNFQATIPVTATTSDQTVMAVDIDNLKLWAGFWDQSADNLYWLANDGSWSSANVDVPGTGSSETCAITGTGFTFFSQNYATRGGSVDFGSLNGGILANITTPSGFKEVNTSNLPAPAVLDGTANFQTTLYTGTAVVRNISQTGNSVFQPDFVWIKNRSAADKHMLLDATRGIIKQLTSDSSATEVDNGDGLTSFSDKLWIDASGETKIGNMTLAAGLANAFDGNTVQGYAACAAGGSIGYCGIDWGSGNTKSITRVVTFGSSDYGYSNPGRTINIKLEGSTDNFSSSVVDLGGGTGDFTDAIGADKIITPTDTTAYRYHRMKETSSVGSTHFCEIEFFENNTGVTRGFTLSSGPAGYNDNSENFAAWQWLAGGGAGSSNEDGSINTTTTTVSTTAGISIGTYTGTGSNATIGHGLGVAPSMIIVKERSNDVGGWYVYHRMQSGNPFDPQTDYTFLNTNAAKADDATVWQDTAPTSTVFSIGTNDDVNGSSDTYVYYAFADVQGFNRSGGYKGNGSAEGTLAFTGFKPAFVMIKRADDTGNWVMYDNQRSPYNEIDDQLFADTTAAETTGSEEIDFLANGFKIRTADAIINAVNGTYFYMAFAEYPFGGDGASPATAF